MAVLGRHEVVNELDSKLLKPAIYILVGPTAWATRTPEDIIRNERIIDFNASDDATYQFLEQHELLDICQKERHLANNIDALASLVIEGRGYSVLTQDFAEPFLQSNQMTDICPGKDMRLDFALAWYPRHEMPDYFGKLIKAIH